MRIQSSAGREAGHPSHGETGEDREQLLLTVQIGRHTFALVAEAVERIFPMAALVPLPQAGSGVMGMLTIQGTIFPVVDPHPALGLLTPRMHPDQRLVQVCASSRYLLWVDDVVQIVQTPVSRFAMGGAGTQEGPISLAVQVAGETIPVLSVEHLDPGVVLPSVNRPSR